MKRERGFALVITLIVTALLVALLVEFVNEVYVDTSHSHNFVASQQASILAESGIAGGIKLLQASNALTIKQDKSFTSLLDPWAKPLSYDAGAGSVTISMEEESGKFNLNTATSPKGEPNAYTEIAISLLKKLELSPDLADVLMDWVDENFEPKQNGAETSYYSTLKFPYKSKDQRLETVDELALLKGFTPVILTKLRPCVTVYGSTDNADLVTKININTAPKEVIAALGFSDDKVDQILDARKSRPLTSPSDLPDTPPNILATLTFSGNVYRIHAEGKVGGSVSVAEAVVRMGTGKMMPPILYWREY